jgi:hypothetical protein
MHPPAATCKLIHRKASCGCTIIARCLRGRASSAPNFLLLQATQLCIISAEFIRELDLETRMLCLMQCSSALVCSGTST